MNRTSETVANMNAVADAIEEFPERYEQGSWGLIIDENGDVWDYEPEDVLNPTVCKTAHCIAGWACWLNKDQLEWRAEGKLRMAIEGPIGGYQTIAQNLLGLEWGESSVLFNANWRPDENLSVPDALRKIAGGADVLDVSAERIRVDWEES